MLDYQDNYYNLTLQTLGMMHYIDRHIKPRLVMKVDDDSYVNIPRVLDWLYPLDGTNVTFYAGNSVRGASPMRFVWGSNNNKSSFHFFLFVLPVLTPPSAFSDPDSKWYLSWNEFGGNEFPEYCNGNGYFLSADLIAVLAKCEPVDPQCSTAFATCVAKPECPIPVSIT